MRPILQDWNDLQTIADVVQIVSQVLESDHHHWLRVLQNSSLMLNWKEQIQTLIFLFLVNGIDEHYQEYDSAEGGWVQ